MERLIELAREAAVVPNDGGEVAALTGPLAVLDPSFLPRFGLAVTLESVECDSLEVFDTVCEDHSKGFTAAMVWPEFRSREFLDNTPMVTAESEWRRVEALKSETDDRTALAGEYLDLCASLPTSFDERRGVLAKLAERRPRDDAANFTADWRVFASRVQELAAAAHSTVEQAAAPLANPDEVTAHVASELAAAQQAEADARVAAERGREALREYVATIFPTLLELAGTARRLEREEAAATRRREALAATHEAGADGVAAVQEAAQGLLDELADARDAAKRQLDAVAEQEALLERRAREWDAALRHAATLLAYHTRSGAANAGKRLGTLLGELGAAVEDRCRRVAYELDKLHHRLHPSRLRELPVAPAPFDPDSPLGHQLVLQTAEALRDSQDEERRLPTEHLASVEWQMLVTREARPLWAYIFGAREHLRHYVAHELSDATGRAAADIAAYRIVGKLLSPPPPPAAEGDAEAGLPRDYDERIHAREVAACHRAWDGEGEKFPKRLHRELGEIRAFDARQATYQRNPALGDIVERICRALFPSDVLPSEAAAAAPLQPPPPPPAAGGRIVFVARGSRYVAVVDGRTVELEDYVPV